LSIPPSHFFSTLLEREQHSVMLIGRQGGCDAVCRIPL